MPTSRFIGGNNGIPDLPGTPINALIGVWAFSGGGCIPFVMGRSGSAVAPAGTVELFLGTMDGYGWANNTGGYEVEIRSATASLPDGGSTLALLGGSFGVIALARARAKRS